MHYWYVESEGPDPSDPSTPIILWLNGGPGCSSLDGLFYEWGPFRLNHTTKPPSLFRYEHTTSKLGNVLYLESPVGVGYSYSSAKDKSADYTYNDDVAAEDNLKAVEKFFELYPELRSHDFFITGESYGGVYVPTLAEQVLWAMGNGTYKGAPLRGIAVGNGCSGDETGSCGGERDKYDTLYLTEQAFVSSSLKKSIHKECDFDSKPPYSRKCHDLIAQMHETIGHINLYNIYGDCISDRPNNDSTTRMHKAPLGATQFYDRLGETGPDACIDSRFASEYLTQPAVVKAAHLHPINFEWRTCGTARGWSYSSNRPNLPRDTYPALIEHFRVVIYNGDWDACVPYTDNEAWTEGMGLPVADAWHPWTYPSPDDGSKQVGGYATRYKSKTNFTFATVRGGRHEVPETAPAKAFELMRRLVTGQNF